MIEEEFQKKSRRLAMAARWVFLLLMLFFVVQAVITVWMTLAQKLPADTPGVEQSWSNLIFSLIFCVIVVIVMLLVLRLLRAMECGESPFTRGNAKRLRVIGWLLVAFEPLQRVLAHLFWLIASGRVQDGQTVTYYFYSNGGMILMVGLAVLGISAVFEYGVALQQLSDETL